MAGLLGVLAAVMALAGCNDYVIRAKSAYREGRYLEVAEGLARQEQQVQTRSGSQRAQYGLYRGLALLQLGELDGAQQWLDYAAEVEQLAPGSLSADQREQQVRGRRLIDELTGADREPPDPDTPPRPPPTGPAPPWPED